MPVDPAKLAALQKRAVVKAGGVRMKTAPQPKKAVVAEDKKLKAALNRLNCKDVPGIDEVNMFKDDGNVLQFRNPKVQAASGCYVIAGNHEVKKFDQILPSIFQQMGPEHLEALKQQLYSMGGAAAAGGSASSDFPAVDGTFEDASAPSLE